MTIGQMEFNSKLNQISNTAITSQEEIGRLSEHIDKLNSDITNLLKKDINSIHEKGLLKINEDLDHIAFLQDQIQDELNFLWPVIKTLEEQTFWLKNNIYWFTQIKPNELSRYKGE